ncbi:MAG TPA: type III pantothenate kinase, partial [Nitrospira sp.]|nr:type III pantothenate kinase [Nitrospira sp.]
MLLAIDIGNTNVVWGLFEDSTLRGHWRLATESRRTDNEYGILLLNLLHNAGFTPEQITGCILSSVVPALTGTFDSLVQTYFHQTPVIVGPDTDSGLTLRYANPKEIGSDRIVNAAAAYARYRSDLIIVDFGTATTFCAVTKSAEYLGGVIAPGLGISADALFSRTAKLPKV